MDSVLSVLGIPAHQLSISVTNADQTPAAIRAALARYSSYCAEHDVDLTSLPAVDLGDIASPDSKEGQQRTIAAAHSVTSNGGVLVALGGDNSVTYAAALGVWGEDVTRAGLVTFDAHHDLRDGISNGSPVRQLVQAGLAGQRVVQIGIADFANSREYTARARDLGITVISRAQLRHRDLGDVVAEALEIAGSAGGPIHVDIDVDVCDRSVVPGCPAAAPGGISADELRQLTNLAALDTRVRSFDIAEIDATADAPDGRTVRLGALLVLEIACGISRR